MNYIIAVKRDGKETEQFQFDSEKKRVEFYEEARKADPNAVFAFTESEES